MSQAWQQYGAAAGNPWQQYGRQSPATAAMPVAPMYDAPALPNLQNQLYDSPFGSPYLPAPTAHPYAQPAGWVPAGRPAGNQNRNLLISVMAVIVVAVAVVVTVLVIKSSAANGPQQPANPIGAVTQTTSSVGARPFPEPKSAERTTSPAAPSSDTPAPGVPGTHAPTTGAPTQDPSTGDASTGDASTGDPTTGASNTSEPGTSTDQGAVLAAARTFAGAVNAHDLEAVKAMECSAVASQETQSDIDTVTLIAVTGAATVTGQTGTVEVDITDSSGKAGTTSIDLIVEGGGWKVCRAG